MPAVHVLLTSPDLNMLATTQLPKEDMLVVLFGLSASEVRMLECGLLVEARTSTHTRRHGFGCYRALPGSAIGRAHVRGARTTCTKLPSWQVPKQSASTSQIVLKVLAKFVV